MEFLGVKIDGVTKEQALQKVAGFLSGGLPGEALAKTGHKIFTPNPEFVVKAQKDEYFKKVLNSGDLNLCDGMGLQIFTGIKRVPGVDFMLEICRLASEQGRAVYLLGSGSDEVVKKTAEKLQIQFPNLKLVGHDKGPMIDELRIRSKALQLRRASNEENIFSSLLTPSNCELSADCIAKINAIRPDILFVAFGMGKQEKWIYENLAKMPSVKIAMGVGGSFDFISGKVKRAPLFLRRLGLEWVYRLVQEPRRIGRIFNATAKFCYLALKEKIL